jgi:DNA-binding transcriptional regulator YdaS (Cro superfamily)
MDISTYLQQSPRGTAAAIARALGVHPVMVSQWARGIKDIPVERCTALERITGGEVRRWDMRADWREHWPELVNAKDAPATERRGSQPDRRKKCFPIPPELDMRGTKPDRRGVTSPGPNAA